MAQDAERALELVREAWRNALENDNETFLRDCTDEELALDMADCVPEINNLHCGDVMRAVRQVRTEHEG